MVKEFGKIDHRLMQLWARILWHIVDLEWPMPGFLHHPLACTQVSSTSTAWASHLVSVLCCY